jgi:hypothetical protein
VIAPQPLTTLARAAAWRQCVRRDRPSTPARTCLRYVDHFGHAAFVGTGDLRRRIGLATTCTCTPPLLPGRRWQLHAQATCDRVPGKHLVQRWIGPPGYAHGFLVALSTGGRSGETAVHSGRNQHIAIEARGLALRWKRGSEPSPVLPSNCA